jgi:hypothetical protein
MGVIVKMPSVGFWTPMSIRAAIFLFSNDDVTVETLFSRDTNVLIIDITKSAGNRRERLCIHYDIILNLSIFDDT